MKKFALCILTIFILLLPATMLAAESIPPTPGQIQSTPAPEPPVPKPPVDLPATRQDGAANAKITRNDITALSGDITVQENEIVYGNITNASGNITVYGQVFGNITTATGDIYIRKPAKVTGNVTVVTGTIVRDEGTEVNGNIVEGSRDIRLNKGNFPVNFNPEQYNQSFASRTFDSFTRLLGMLAVLAIVLSIFPKNLQKMLGALKIEPARVVLIGVLGWLILPIAMVISVITIVGPVILGLGALASLIAGAIIVSLILGDKIKELFKWQNDNKIITGLIGLAALWLASLFPLAFVFIMLICSVIGMGVMLTTKFGTGRPWFPPKSAIFNQPVAADTQEIINSAKGVDENESPRD